MANISVKISPDSKINDLSYYDQYDYGISNISSNIEEVKNRVSKGGNPFLLGVSEFRDKATFVYEKADFFVTTFFSQQPREYNELHFNGENVKFIIVHFDTVNLQFPRHIIFRGREYINDSPVFVAATDRSDYLGLYMSEWNKPNRPAIIQGITTVAEIDSNELINLNFSGQDRSDPTLPSWGIKSNSGYLEMFDTYGIIENMQKIGLLTNSGINIYLNAGNRQEQIGGFYVSNANKDRQTSKIKIEFKDILMSWENIEVRSYPLHEFLSGKRSNALIDTILKENNITMEHSPSNSKYISYPYIEGGSAWAVLTKFCELTGSYIYCDNNGTPTMHYSRGN